jgi:hypothetical protein
MATSKRISFFALSIVLYLVYLVNITHLEAPRGSSPEPKTRNLSTSLENTLKVEIICRTFHGAMFEIMRLLLTYCIFCPYSEKLIIVLDAEVELDRKVGLILETAFSKLGVQVFYEMPPPANTVTNRVRYEGYSRTQWSNFYSDLYSDADIIGIVDSDTEFSFRPNFTAHVAVDQKPVIHGIYLPLLQAIQQDCVQFMLKKPYVATFMYVFPFFVKREHFKLMREYVVNTTGKNTFEEAWYDMQVSLNDWGQFLVMGHYLFWFHYDEYMWDLANVPTHSNMIAPVLAHHLPMNTDVSQTATKYTDQMCWKTSSCEHFHVSDEKLRRFALYSDFWPLEKGVDMYNLDLVLGDINRNIDIPSQVETTRKIMSEIEEWPNVRQPVFDVITKQVTY